MIPTRQVYFNITGVWLMYVLLAITLAVFFYGIYRRWRPWQIGRPVARFDRIGERLKKVLQQGPGHKKLLERYRGAGFAHLLIFWGFVFLFLGTVVVFIHEDLHIHIMQGQFYLYFQSLTLNIFGLLCISGIVIDLRSNPGGSLEEAIKFTGLFIKGGPVVLARNPDGQVQVDTAPAGMQTYDGPLAVMINRFSASASEIVAAALQDYGRAIIVGDTSTHGKGTVQNLNPLKPFMLGSTNDPGTIKITIRKFYRVSGASTQLKGVSPDIVLPDVLNYSTQVGENSLDNPLPWDTIQPVNYQKLNLVQPLLATLKAHSVARIATNQDFTYVQQDIAQFQKQQADKTVTLNEHDAIKERERIASQNKAREDERNARMFPAVKIYDITVENADQPGLTEAKADADETNTVTATSNSTSNPVVTKVSGGTTTTNRTFTGTSPGKKSAPPFDPVLDETENILLDYISLAGKTSPLMANQ